MSIVKNKIDSLAASKNKMQNKQHVADSSGKAKMQTLLKMNQRRILKIFFSWSKSVDVNCYSKIFEYKQNCACQLVWILILLGSTSATFWIISLSIMSYLDYEVVSQIKVVYEKPTKFPAITICDNDPFTSKDAEGLFYSLAYSSGATLSSINKVNHSLNYLALMRASNPSYGDTSRKKLGFDKSLISYCTYYNTKCFNDMHWYWSYTYGNCWQFNSGFNMSNQLNGIKMASVEGQSHGFALI